MTPADRAAQPLPDLRWLVLVTERHVRLHRRREDDPVTALCGCDLRRAVAGDERAVRCRVCVATAARKGLT